MTPLDVALVRRKLAGIVSNLERLAAVETLTLSQYTADPFRQMLLEIVEAAVDVNLHLLRHGGRTAPDYYTSFIEAGRAGIIPGDLARKLAPSVAASDFREYVRHVEEWVERQED